MRLIEQAEVDEPDFGVFLRLAASTGARRGELCALYGVYRPRRWHTHERKEILLVADSSDLNRQAGRSYSLTQ